MANVNRHLSRLPESGEPTAEQKLKERVGDFVIVTRHKGTVDWLAAKGIAGPVLEHATAEDVRGKHVYGVLPLHLAAEATSVHVVEIPNLPAEMRGVDLTPMQMIEYGATLREYRVTEVTS